MTKSLRAFNVYRPRDNGGHKLIDTVFYNSTDTITAEEVKDSLINHDGYEYNIEVVEDRTVPRRFSWSASDEQAAHDRNLNGVSMADVPSQGKS